MCFSLMISRAACAAAVTADAAPANPLSIQLLTKACDLLASSHAFSFHADILFD